MFETENPMVDQSTIPGNTEEETPAIDEVQASAEGTTPNTDTANSDNGATPADNGNTDDGSNADTPPAAEPKFRIRYNHQNEDLSLEEITAAAQKGRFFEQHEDTFATLEYVAELTGQSIKEVVENLRNTMDRLTYDNALSEAGNDAYKANQIFEGKRSAAKSRLDEKVNARNADNDLKAYNEKKLADEFLKFGKLMGMEKVTEVPPAVIETAINEGITIYDAYLRQRYSDDQNIQKNNKQQQKNTAAAPPAINNGAEQNEFKDFAQRLLDA